MNKTKATVIYNLIFKVVSYHFHHILFFRSKSPGSDYTQGKGLYKGMNIRSQGSGDTSEAAFKRYADVGLRSTNTKIIQNYFLYNYYLSVIATGCYVYSNLYFLFLCFLIKGFLILMFSLIQSMESSLPFISSTLFQLYSYIWLFYDFCPILLMISL